MESKDRKKCLKQKTISPAINILPTVATASINVGVISGKLASIALQFTVNQTLPRNATTLLGTFASLDLLPLVDIIDIGLVVGNPEMPSITFALSSGDGTIRIAATDPEVPAGSVIAFNFTYLLKKPFLRHLKC